MIKMILCADSKHGIGKDGSIPWHSSADFKHFKEETQGKKVLMGYKTWESLPKRPLPDRVNIVVTTRDVPDEVINQHRDVIFIHQTWIPLFLKTNKDVVIIGGSKIYQSALPFVDQIVLSTIEGDFECDTFFDIHSGGLEFKPTNMKELEDGIVVTYYDRIKPGSPAWGDWV